MANDPAREVWAARAAGWARNDEILDAAVAPFTIAVLEAAEFGTARRVLDIGCGTGTLLDAAVTAGADAVGVDISESMTAAADQRVPAATAVTADAQTADLATAAPEEPFDRVVSRFGVMFLEDPPAAFANIRAATATGGQLAFVCWRQEESEMFLHGVRSLQARLQPPASPRSWVRWARWVWPMPITFAGCSRPAAGRTWQCSTSIDGATIPGTAAMGRGA